MRPDPALLIAVALLAGGAACVAPLATGAAAVAGLLVLWCRVRAAAWVLVSVALLLGMWRAQGALERFEVERAQVRGPFNEPRRCALRARVTASPTWRGGQTTLRATVLEADCEGRALEPGLGVRLHGGPVALTRGSVVRGIAQLAPVSVASNPGTASALGRAALRREVLSGSLLTVEIEQPGSGWRALVDRARTHARARILLTFAPAARDMARALVLGEEDLDEAESRAFKASGLAHMLAVSGTHLVFAVVALVLGLRFVLVRVPALAARWDVGRLAAAFGAPAALLYADFAGGTGSAWRAAWMLAVVFLARVLGRRASVTRAVAGSLLVAAIQEPLAVFDLSLLLSAAATAGLVGIGRPLADSVRRVRWRLLRWLLLSGVATVSSTLPCAPLLLLLGGRLTVAGIFANVLASPFGELFALPLCLVHPLLACSPPLERGVALAASGALLVVKHVAFGSASVTWLAFSLPAPGAWHLSVLAVGVTGAVVRQLRWAWLVMTVAGLWVVESATVEVGCPRGELRMTAVDVGQGDSLFVDLPGGGLLVVDGGGSAGHPSDFAARTLLGLLAQRRRRRIDLLVLSHAHPDHLQGLLGIVREVPVGEFWDNGLGSPLRDALAGRGVPIRGPREICGRHRRSGAILEVLGPCPAARADAGANDNSLVLRLSLGARRILLVGDAGQRAEQALLATPGAQLSADLLKVGHHGSSTSSSEAFLAAVQPALAVISSGARNRFGHPHARTLERLDRAGAHVLRTDWLGAITWRTDGQRVWVGAAVAPRIGLTGMAATATQPVLP